MRLRGLRREDLSLSVRRESEPSRLAEYRTDRWANTKKKKISKKNSEKRNFKHFFEKKRIFSNFFGIFSFFFESFCSICFLPLSSVFLYFVSSSSSSYIFFFFTFAFFVAILASNIFGPIPADALQFV